MRGLPSLLIFSLLVLTLQALTFNHSYIKDSQSLSSAKCSLDTPMNIGFSSSSLLSCSSTTCTVENPEQNQIIYLDSRGSHVAYILTNAQLIQENFIDGCDFGFTFEFQDQAMFKKLFLTVPICTSMPSSLSSSTIDLSLSKDYSLTTLGSISDSTLNSGVPLSGFNFLSTLDFKKFYQVMNQAQTQTWLISKVLFKISFTPNSRASESLLASFQPDYTTANVICWSSVPESVPLTSMRRLANGDVKVGSTLVFNDLFQTHMRQSITLWFFVVMILLMWMFVLCSNENTDEVFETSFQDNKWTSWSLYSLFNLAHEQFFTRLSRTVLVMITISWQAMVTTAIYSRIPVSETDAVVIWAAVVGWAASIPFPYILGGCFLSRIYESEVEKLTLKINAQKLQGNEKVKKQELQREVIEKTQQINSIYFFYYSIIFALFAVFSILSVHVMQPLINSESYRYKEWLATMGVIIACEFFILEPILAGCFGTSRWFTLRGFYYNSELASLYKQAEC